jgi:hypothetical protein
LVAEGGDVSGGLTAVPVEVGLSDGVYTQIVRGLNLGDKVAVQMSASQGGQFNFRMLGGAMPVMMGAPRTGR